VLLDVDLKTMTLLDQTFSYKIFYFKRDVGSLKFIVFEYGTLKMQSTVFIDYNTFHEK